jgi:hypothetical protein
MPVIAATITNTNTVPIAVRVKPVNRNSSAVETTSDTDMTMIKPYYCGDLTP